MRRKIKTSPLGPLANYYKDLKSGRLVADNSQESLARELEKLYLAIQTYQSVQRKKNWRKWFGLSNNREQPCRGLYIYGGVGRGKSMLMDIFFDTVHLRDKRRVHFHAFLQEIHTHFNDFRKKNPKGGDPIPHVTRLIAEKATLLCFDELQVVNIVDAMIIGRLFEGLFKYGVIIVATSNRPPDDLYKDGLQREKFLPFIDLIKQKLDVFKLDAERDYRLERILGMRVFHQPLGEKAEDDLNVYFRELTKGYTPVLEKISIKGRSFEILSAAGVARTSFNILCGSALGPADYLEVARRYHTIILEGKII